jgi:peptide/nickel transport system substrate-binding protein
MMGVRAVLVAALVCVVLVVGTMAPATGQASRRDVVVGLIQEPDILNSVITSTAATRFVIMAMMDFATYYDQTWKPTADIVESVPNMADGTWRMLAGNKMRLIWRLRPNVKWSDGRDVTASDFAFTHELVRDPEVGAGSSFNCGFGKAVERVEALDARTIAVTWAQVYPFANTCVSDGGLLPRHRLESEYRANPAKFKETTFGRDAAATIGNGPFILRSWTRGSEMVFEANPNYWRGRPALDRVVFRIFSDANAMLANLISGAIDVIPSGFVGLSFGQALQVQDLIKQGRARGLKVELGPSLLFESLTPNLENPILKDKRVRQALAYASNREGISRSLYQGQQVVAHSPFPSNHPDFDRSIKRYPFDLTRAKALLEEAGWRPGPDGIRRNAQGDKLSIVVTTTAGNRDREREQQILQESWKEAGIELVIENFPSRVVFGSMVYQRKYKGFILQSNGFSRPEATLEKYVASYIAPEGEFSQNFTAWRNADVDRLAEEYNRELSVEKRRALLVRFQRIWAEEVPEVALYWFAAATAYKENLQNYKQIGLAAYPEPVTWNIHEWRWQ